LRSSSIKKQADSVAWGVAVKTIPIKELRQFILPLPPLAEQEKIVARVEQHLQTITQLETQIATRETTTKQLMQSILKDAFEEK
jgi:type I restriction enzyme S subunit